MTKTLGWAVWALALLLPLGAAGQAPAGSTLETAHLRWKLDAAGRSVGFVDRATGHDYQAGLPEPLAMVRAAGQAYASTRCAYDGKRVTLTFTPPGVTVAVDVAKRGAYLVMRVASVTGPPIEELTLSLPRVSLGKQVSDMAGTASDGKFACALRVLDPTVEFRLAGGPTPGLSAAFSPGRKLVGAGIAVVACPASRLRDALKEVVRREGLPYSALGGPFALDARQNRGSYVFASGLSETNVDQWIALCRKAGIAEVHMIGWERSSGHYGPNPTLFPHGLEGLRATVGKIHKAGLMAGMHTLTGLITPDDAYITPVPDPHLSVDATFTLTSAVGASDGELTVGERPQNLDTIWAYGSRGNVLRIDDELIQYSGYSDQPPYRFTQCRRGAFGTRAQAHAAGAPARHLGVYAGCFLPDPESALIDGIAGNIATVFNQCGFDMVYMDGAEGTPGGWYGVAKMRAAIFSRLHKPAMVEASEWGYPSWPFHSRVGAWDYPNWGLKQFVDIHCQSNELVRSSALLPAQLGWWSIFGPNDDRYAQSPDETEYLFCKALAFDMPMSFQGIGIGQPENERQDEILQMMGRYEQLRLARSVPESVRAKLRAPGQDFHLAQEPGGRWSFVPTDYLAHKVTGTDDGSTTWTVRNRYGGQPLTLRVQALHSAAPYDSPDGVTLADWQGELPKVEASAGASGALVLDASAEGGPAAAFTGAAPASGRAWVRAPFTFAPRDLGKCGALGVWVFGDGKGETLNLQLSNPVQYWPTFDEHYVTVDFTGWRYFELPFRERDAARHGEFGWPYGDIYSVYRDPLIRGAVNALNLYMSVPAGVQAKVLLRPVRALPVAAVKLQNPVVTLNGKDVAFPVTLSSGQYLEFTAPSDARVYDERGKRIGTVSPRGAAAALRAGDTTVSFRCDGPAGYRPRALVTVVAAGEPLRR